MPTAVEWTPTVAGGVKITRLEDRGVVGVTGPDGRNFLQGLVSNDMALVTSDAAMFAGLLSPQGKILFEFFIVAHANGFLLECAASRLGDLIKRLAMYKLRANVQLTDLSADFHVLALWGVDTNSPGETSGSVSYRDPRSPNLGIRILAEARFAIDIASATNGMDASNTDYHAHRVSLSVPEGGRDYDFGDVVPHDANFDLLGGVSFTKGCYVGQEIVSRMQNKSVIRKRIVKIASPTALITGTDVMMGHTSIGRVGTVANAQALSLLRIDRVAEAIDSCTALTVSDMPIDVDPDAVSRYRAALAKSLVSSGRPRTN